VCAGCRSADGRDRVSYSCEKVVVALLRFSEAE